MRALNILITKSHGLTELNDRVFCGEYCERKFFKERMEKKMEEMFYLMGE